MKGICRAGAALNSRLPARLPTNRPSRLIDSKDRSLFLLCAQHPFERLLDRWALPVSDQMPQPIIATSKYAHFVRPDKGRIDLYRNILPSNLAAEIDDFPQGM